MRRNWAFFLAFVACAKVGSPPGKPELAGPVVRIVSPLNGDTVSDTVMVIVDAFDPSGVRRVLLRADGEDVGPDSTSPYQIPWPTAELYDQEHRLVAIAYDRWDNEGRSDTVRVFTLNGNEPPPDTGKRGVK
ncbi:MAG: Ig-like domain-containing protein [candidate division WOR-3 bacterium]